MNDADREGIREWFTRIFERWLSEVLDGNPFKDKELRLGFKQIQEDGHLSLFFQVNRIGDSAVAAYLCRTILVEAEDE